MSFSVHTVVLVTPVVFALVKRGSFGSEDELPGVDVAAVGGAVDVLKAASASSASELARPGDGREACSTASRPLRRRAHPPGPRYRLVHLPRQSHAIDALEQGIWSCEVCDGQLIHHGGKGLIHTSIRFHATLGGQRNPAVDRFGRRLPRPRADGELLRHTEESCTLTSFGNRAGRRAIHPQRGNTRSCHG